MTIGEKSSEYAEKCFPSDDISNYGKHDVAFHSHTAGANWMLEKAVQRFAKEVSEFDTLLYLIDKTSEGLINKENTVEKFRKALEE